MRYAIEVVFTADERRVLQDAALCWRIGWPELHPDGEDEVARQFTVGKTPDPVTMERLDAAISGFERLLAVIEMEIDPDLWRSVVGDKPSALVANPAATVEYLVSARTRQLAEVVEALAVLRDARRNLMALYAAIPGRVGWPDEDDDLGEEQSGVGPKGEWRGMAINVDFEEMV